MCVFAQRCLLDNGCVAYYISYSGEIHKGCVRLSSELTNVGHA